jgi:hypothetical protein
MKRTALALHRPGLGHWLAWLVLASGLVLATSAHALYKVVGPDGRITYTDRAPGVNEGRVSPLGGRTVPVVNEVVLPVELRQAATRYPVTLYTTSGVCEPCDAARAQLRQRGVPHRE